MQKPQAIIEKMDKLRVELMYSIINYVWKEDLGFFSVDESTDGVMLGDYYVSDNDMEQIVRNEIQEDVCYEYWDYHSHNHEQLWIKEAKKEHGEDFLKTLFLFDKMRKG